MLPDRVYRIVKTIIKAYMANLIRDPITNKYRLLPTVWTSLSAEMPQWIETYHGTMFAWYTMDLCDHYALGIAKTTVANVPEDIKEMIDEQMESFYQRKKIRRLV
jgi:hypothetical protein